MMWKSQKNSTKTKAVLSATNNYINGQSLDELEKTLDKKVEIN